MFVQYNNITQKSTYVASMIPSSSEMYCIQPDVIKFKVESLIPAHSQVYWTQPYVINFVSYLRYFGVLHQ